MANLDGRTRSAPFVTMSLIRRASQTKRSLSDQVRKLRWVHRSNGLYQSPPPKTPRPRGQVTRFLHQSAITTPPPTSFTHTHPPPISPTHTHITHPATPSTHPRTSHTRAAHAPVDDPVPVQEHERQRHLGGVEPRARLVELARALDLEHEVSAVHVLHHEEQPVLQNKYTST